MYVLFSFSFHTQRPHKLRQLHAYEMIFKYTSTDKQNSFNHNIKLM